MNRRSDGSPVGPEDVLSDDDLRDYYKAHPRPRYDPDAGLSIGADPAVVAWEEAVASHLERGNE